MKFGYCDALAICMCSLLLACTETQEVATTEPDITTLARALGKSFAEQSALESATWDSAGGLDEMKHVSAIAP